MLRNTDRHVTEMLRQNYSRPELFHVSLLWKPLHSVRGGCVEVIAGQIRSQGQKLFRRRIHLQNLWGHPDGFSWLIINRDGLSSKYSTSSGFFFFARTGVAMSVDSPVLFCQKRDRGKTRLASIAVRDLSSQPVDPSWPSSNNFFICSLGIGFLWTTPAMLPDFLRCFTNALIPYLPE